MTRERMRELQRNWKERRKLDGLCRNCWTRKAGEDEGTANFCGTCRREKVARENNRRRAAGLMLRQDWLMKVRKPKVIRTPKPKKEPKKRTNAGWKLREYLRSKPEDLKFQRKPVMADTAARVERMFALQREIQRLERGRIYEH